MHPKRFFMSVSWLLVISLLASLSGSPTASAQVGTQAVIIDQLSGATVQDGAKSMYWPNFPSIVIDYRSADDFTVQATGLNNFLQITSLSFVGYSPNATLPPINKWIIRVYSPSGNLPGHYANSVLGYQEVTASVISGTITIPTNIFLRASTTAVKRWLSIQGNINTSTPQQFSWAWQSSNVAGSGGTLESAFIDVTGATGDPSFNCYQTWASRVTACLQGVQNNLAYSLSGQEWYLPYSVFLPIIGR